MRRKNGIIIGAISLMLLFSAIAFASFNAVETQTGHEVLVLEPGDIFPNPDPCTCSAVVDPVVCGTYPDKKFYSNQCVANCDGATNCAQVELQY